MQDPTDTWLNRIMLGVLCVVTLPLSLYYWLTGKDPNK